MLTEYKNDAVFSPINWQETGVASFSIHISSEDVFDKCGETSWQHSAFWNKNGFTLLILFFLLFLGF